MPSRRSAHADASSLEAQLAPVVGEPLDVRDLVCLVRLPETLEPGIAGLRVHLGARDDRGHLAECVVHGRPDRARRAIDVLERGRDALDEGHRADSRQHRILAGNALDLADGLPYPQDRRL